MNKSAGVLLGIVVAIGAISAGGAWYTGTKIEGVLNNAVTNANKELQTAMAGSNGTASLELVSLERHLFSSTAHYRLKGQGEMFGEHADGVVLQLADPGLCKWFTDQCLEAGIVDQGPQIGTAIAICFYGQLLDVDIR